MESSKLLQDFFATCLISFIAYNHFQNKKYRHTDKFQTFWPRLWASKVDELVLLPVTAFLSCLFVKINQSLLFFVFVGYASLIYSVLFHGYKGATLGKSCCNIKVVRVETEEIITLKEAFIRDSIPIILNTIILFYALYTIIFNNVSPAASFLSFGSIYIIWFVIEVITMLSNEKRRALHDYIAGTVVVRTNLKN